MEKLLQRLRTEFPALVLTPGRQFCWSPASGEVIYDASRRGPKARWSLLHETGHALLGHTTYQADFELIKMEMAAWAKARELGAELGIKINEDHIQDCLDTYRDWLYKRSICPHCHTKCLQEADYAHYRCHNCHSRWRVTPSRFARPYRRSKDIVQTPVVFH